MYRFWLGVVVFLQIISLYILVCFFSLQNKYLYAEIHKCVYTYTGVGREGGGGHVPPPPPSTFNPTFFYFPLELYVYITLTNNYFAFFIYQLMILWTISINWHRWLLVNNHISKYNSVLYRRYIKLINYESVCPSPHFLAPSYATDI